MKNQSLRIVKLQDIPQGGFAGIVEKQMVISPKLSTRVLERNDISHGFNGFIYLATGHFKPFDGAQLHPHENVDIVTWVLDGSVAHQGTLGDGTVVKAPNVQVQRAGTGMRHSEVNNGDSNAGFVQIWFLPPKIGLAPDYQNIDILEGQLNTVLGGDCRDCFDNPMTCRVGILAAGSVVECVAQFIVLITEGTATANGQCVTKGDLLEGEYLHLKADSKLGLVVIQ